MEESLNSIKKFALGFKVPDFSKLWRGSDEVDGPPTPLVIKLEYYLVRCQELALWTDPKSSALALVVIHAVFGYLATTTNTAINLTLWALLCSFVYTTWTQRIWPEIRVEEPETKEDWTPVHPDVYSAPEVAEILKLVKTRVWNAYIRAGELRRTNHAKFCGLSSVAFVLVAFLGSLVSTFNLMYYLVVGAFILPALIRVLVKHRYVESDFFRLKRPLCNFVGLYIHFFIKRLFSSVFQNFIIVDGVIEQTVII